uniref:Uncharacterized protein n=1 Tax=Chaetoceros debilis TaxID=122233 RepID=A0A7S3PTM8_9STRA|mmetsp:Transcript_6618/g.9688  ORF Transcript_6618/g.9688 Transcript_6618/m.9688 type:complete len:184 (-) Transcript_6618:669-1220(-)|eukprot:CAMPEP_0194118678 /NCGR_PEP_ID=MMETSP0150-20130528/36587_1 /TAXON_ID=122233 /ORGANISM="Chaetoceros debilis, Strain MM31A-1" /LENGTH=183 /DNA_ID=CAMNT_0038810147 /DNA_START=18 /DNA_END=569 /DNA_ORIENTATION=-
MSKRNILETIDYDYCRDDSGNPNKKKYGNPHRRERKQSFMKVYNDFDDWRSHNRHAASQTKSLSARHSLDNNNNRPNRRIDVDVPSTSTITTENESSEEYKNAIMNWDIRFTSPLRGPLQGIDSSSTRTLVQRFSMEEDEDEADYDYEYDCFIPVPHRHIKAVRYLFDAIFQLSKSQKSTCFP